MLFIANTLPMNGGSTFLIRACKELFTRGIRPGVLVLFNKNDSSIVEELGNYADIYYLSDFSYSLIKPLFKNQLGLFLPLRTDCIYKKIAKYKHMHVMGIFGLLFFIRLVKRFHIENRNFQVKLSVGIYHQNEFMYSAPKFYFSTYAQNLFVKIDNKSIVFFNENSISSYSNFFKKDYHSSPLLPVGINIPKGPSLGDPTSNRIVSIGQLYNFKTYNEHVINSMPNLLKINKNLVYEIYGEGPEVEKLKKLTDNLHIQESVLFKGNIEYSEIPKTLKGCLVFVGSGTAIIESASYGIPSIIGIESNKNPVTYGFFSSAEGFSYHELVDGKKTFSFEDTLKKVIVDTHLWNKESINCKTKSLDFSIVRTIDGLLLCGEPINHENAGSNYNNLRALFSFLGCSFLDKTKINTEFSNRRNQGSIGNKD